MPWLDADTVRNFKFALSESGKVARITDLASPGRIPTSAMTAGMVDPVEFM